MNNRDLKSRISKEELLEFRKKLKKASWKEEIPPTNNSTKKYQVHAHRIVQSDKKKGLIVSEPCMVCEKEKAEMHHWDYHKPRHFVWLCRKHHNEFHRWERKK